MSPSERSGHFGMGARANKPISASDNKFRMCLILPACGTIHSAKTLRWTMKSPNVDIARCKLPWQIIWRRLFMMADSFRDASIKRFSVTFYLRRKESPSKTASKFNIYPKQWLSLKHLTIIFRWISFSVKVNRAYWIIQAISAAFNGKERYRSVYLLGLAGI